MKHKVKMIVFDLDGTLLKTDKTISSKTKSVLFQCRDSGIKVAYATGRGGSAKRVAPSELFDGRISMNGAIAYNGNELVYRCLIPYSISRPLLIACTQRGLRTASEFSDMHYSNFIVSDEWRNITNFRIVDFAQHDIDAEKLYAIVQNPDDAQFIERYLPDELYLTVSRDGIAQIMHKDATKSKAIAKLAQIWNISQSEIIAFGDDLNDLDMLSYAGVGIAMGNAIDEVKTIADCITLNNDEDGVAAWLMKNVL